MNQSNRDAEETVSSLARPGYLSLRVGLLLTIFSFPILWLYPFLYQIVALRFILNILAVVCQIGLILGFILLAFAALKAVYRRSTYETNWWAWKTGPFR